MKLKLVIIAMITMVSMINVSCSKHYDSHRDVESERSASVVLSAAEKEALAEFNQILSSKEN